MQALQPAEGPHRVLVVDDDADTAAGLAELLNLCGFSARAAYSGPEAMAAARAEPPDVVVLDLWMPGMSGWELAEALTALPEPPVLVAVTGVGGAAAEERSAAAGMRLHLLKPVEPQRLVGILGRIREVAPTSSRVGAA